MVNADLKPELSMILEAFILSSNSHTHEQPQLVRIIHFRWDSYDWPLIFHILNLTQKTH